MASQETLNRVQALYVAYYGRPADQDGQEYWAARVEEEGEGAIINAFGNSAEYTERFGDQTNADAVNTLYQQMFNRDAEPNGLAYWVGVLESGEKTLAEIATTIMNAAGGSDRLMLDAKVKAAAAYTAEFGAADDYDLEAATDAVANAKASVDASGLTEMLVELQTAQSDLNTFIKEAASNEFVEEQLAVEPEEASEAQVRTAIDNANGAAKTALELDGGLGQGDSLNVLKAKVLDAEEALASAEEAMGEEDGLTAAKNALASAQAAYEAAYEATEEADVELQAEFAKVEKLNEDSGLILSVNTGFNGDDDKTAIENDGQPFIVLGSNGQLEAAEEVNTEASPVAGFDALLTAAQAAYDADRAEQTAKTAFEAELEDVLDIESEGWNDVPTEEQNVTLGADSNEVEAVNADTLLFNSADGTYLASDGTDFYDATVDSETGAVSFNSTSESSADEGAFSEVANVQIAVGSFTDENEGTVTGSTLLSNDAGNYLATDATGDQYYTATVDAATGNVTFNSTETAITDTTGYSEVDYVPSDVAVGEYTDANSEAATTGVALYALADESGYVVQTDGGEYYTADVSVPSAVTWDSSTSAVAEANVDVDGGALNAITVETGAATEIDSYYNISLDGDDNAEVSFIGNFATDAELVNAVLNAEATLEGAEAQVTEREELIADYEATQQLVADLKANDTAIEDAETALDDEGYVIKTLTDDAGSDSDVFLFADDEGTSASIAGFGDAGDDSIFFGEGYTLNVLGEDADIATERLGDNDALEIFVQEIDGSTKLFVESDEFAGNDRSADALTEITLTGVTGEASLDADGFLTIA